MSLILTSRQKKICDGLKVIGEGALKYFNDAMEIYYNEKLNNRASYLGHIARELDGGIRDCFLPENDKKQSHFEEILSILDVPDKNEFAKKWHDLASQFNRYAHRKAFWQQQRSFDEIKPLWDEYEEVLEKLIGSFYAMAERIDSIISKDDVSKGNLNTIANMIKNEPFKRYVFKKLTNTKWLEPLKTTWIFDLNNIYDSDGNAQYWYVLDYLERISKRLIEQPKYSEALLEIISNVTEESKKHRINNYWIWRSIVNILLNMPTKAAAEYYKESNKFGDLLNECIGMGMSGTPSLEDVADKLLPKYLGDDETIYLAEIILDHITQIRSGGRIKPLSKYKEPQLVYSDYWLLDSIEKNSGLIASKCSDRIIYSIADRLKMVLEYEHPENAIIYKVKGSVYEIRISRIITETVNRSISIDQNIYNVMVRQYSDDQIKGVDVEVNRSELFNIEPSIKIEKIKLSAKNRDEFAVKMREVIMPKIGETDKTEFEVNMKKMYGWLFSDYSNIWFDEDGMLNSSEPKEALSRVLTYIMDAKCGLSDNNSAEEIIKVFLGEKYRYPVIKKIAMKCMLNHWERYSGLIGEVLRDEQLLKKTECNYEVYLIFEKYAKEPNGIANKKIMALIGDIPDYYMGREEKEAAGWQYEWLFPLKDIQYFSEKYQEARRKAGIKETRPPKHERPFVGVRDIVERSPLTMDEILRKSNNELVKYFNEFEGADFWNSAFEGKPSKDGLASVFRASIKEDPNKFSGDISPFIGTKDIIYVNNLIWGFRDAWNSEKDISWGEVLGFIKNYLENNKDKTIPASSERGKLTFDWILQSTADIIEDGTKTDKHAFHEEYFGVTDEIFELMIPHLKGGEFKADTDSVTYSLNTTLGRVLMAYIIFSLRVKRKTGKTEPEWGKNKYERYLMIGIEGYVWLGRYLVNIRYLDEDYIDTKAIPMMQGCMNSSQDNYIWERFFEGYLSAPYFNDEIYDMLYPQYSKAIDKQETWSTFDKQLVQHIAFGYLKGKESLDEKDANGRESLLWKLLNTSEVKEKRGRWIELVDFFWTLTGKNTSKMSQKDENALPEEWKSKILEFWAWTYGNQGHVKEKLGDKYEEFLGHLAELTLLLDKIDETHKGWVELSAKCTEKVYALFFIDHLMKFTDDESLSNIGEVFIALLSGGTPTYPKEKIITIVKRLYRLWEKDKLKYSKVKEDANEICDTYGKMGCDFLKEVWDEYNKNIDGVEDKREKKE